MREEEGKAAKSLAGLGNEKKKANQTTKPNAFKENFFFFFFCYLLRKKYISL